MEISSSPEPRKRQIAGLTIAAYVVVACLAMVSLEAWHGWRSRVSMLDDARSSAESLATLLAARAAELLDMADISLVALADEMLEGRLLPTAPGDLPPLFSLPTRLLDRDVNLFLIDPNGRVVGTSDRVRPTLTNAADLEIFRRHRDLQDPAPLIGPPIQLEPDRKWRLTYSRRVATADGRFLGVVLATIFVEALSRRYENFAIGRGGVVVLLSASGVEMIRYPYLTHSIGQDNIVPRFRADLALGQRSGTWEGVDPIDHHPRIFAWRGAQEYPFVVLIGISREWVLRSWRVDVSSRAIGAALLLLILFGLGLVQIRAARRSVRDREALAKSEQEFRLLAEQSGHLVIRLDQDFRRVYVSPASVDLLGWLPSEMLAREFLDDVAPEDRDRMAEATRGFFANRIEREATTYRMLRKDGRQIWVEGTIQRTHRTGTGELTGGVAIIRDVTAAKVAEAELHRLAVTDGLTKLANRRGFDEALEAAWLQGANTGQPVSLLMIDIDRFKVYNDSYGHQQGDTCLTSVAEAIGGATRRSGDVAARFGGEEFAVILPNTDLTDAATLAERVRAAVQQRGLVHQGNPPSGVVTVSIGATTMWPSSSMTTAETLVSRADEALYQAKESGRNRVMSSQREADPGPVPGPTG